MSEPWYQVVGPTRKEVLKDLFECMKFKIDDHELLKEIISTLVREGTDFGSWRGYMTFLHPQYKKEVIERYEYLTNKHIKPAK